MRPDRWWSRAAEQEIAKSAFSREENQEEKMRTMLLGTAAIIAILLTVPAQADRMCRKVCHEGFCKSQCVSSGPRLYMHEGSRHYHRHDTRPGVGVEINR